MKHPQTPTIFSGVAPSGQLHIGNYIGAIRQWVARQEASKSIFCVVDLHAITTFQDPVELAKKNKEMAALYIACGINPDRSVIFIQSHNRDHAHMAWILNCFIPMGWMNRMTQFKDKSQKQKDIVSVGLFAYPSLMAADILLYDTTEVPVGEDQKQHLELARDTAIRMNQKYGSDLFVVPTPVIGKVGARVMSLQDPESKMSKSDENAGGSIYLLDPSDVIVKKIKRAVTDSQTTVQYDEKRPGISNLITMYSAISGQTPAQIEAQYDGKGYGAFKGDLAELMVNHLTPIQTRFHDLMKHPDHLDAILKKGADAARAISSPVVDRIEKAVGLG